MKFLLTILGILLLTQAQAQFEATWKIRLNNNYSSEESILFTQNGDSFRGKFKNGDIITGSWDEEKNEIAGFLKIDRKLHKFKGFFKNKNKKDMVIAKYCKCSGEPDIPMVFIKEKQPNIADWRKAEETVTILNEKPAKNYAGRYVITITNLYVNTNDDGPFAIFDDTAEIFGTAGIYMNGKGKSGKVAIRPVNGKANRVWNVSESNPVFIQQKNKSYKKLEDAAGKTFNAMGHHEIDKSRSFVIDGELANEKLYVDIQMHLSDKDGLSNDEFGWTRRMIFIKNIELNKEYLVVSKKVNNGRVAIGFIIEKF